MSAYQEDAEAGKHNAAGPPALRVVRRGYDRDEVDVSFSRLAARLREALDQYAKAEQTKGEFQREVTSLRERSPSFEQLGGEAAAVLQEAGRSAEQLVDNARRRAETIIEKAHQQAEQVRADVTNEAQKVLEQAREVAEQIRREAEQERAAVLSETEQVREFRDGLLDDLDRVHGEISGLLERIRKQRDQALGAGRRRSQGRGRTGRQGQEAGQAGKGRRGQLAYRPARQPKPSVRRTCRRRTRPACAASSLA